MTEIKAGPEGLLEKLPYLIPHQFECLDEERAEMKFTPDALNALSPEERLDLFNHLGAALELVRKVRAAQANTGAE